MKERKGKERRREREREREREMMACIKRLCILCGAGFTIEEE